MEQNQNSPEQSDSSDVSSEINEATEESSVSESNFTEKTWREDVTLCVENKKLHVSKAILALVSPVFSSMFESDFLEKSQSEITLHGKNYEDVVEFLQCVYPNIMKPVALETVLRVLPLADEYQVDTLLKKCENVLLEIANSRNKPVSPEDLCLFLNHACMYRLHTLKEHCISALSMVKFDEFQAAEVEHPILCYEAKSEIQTMMLTKMSGELKRAEDTVTNISDELKIIKDGMIMKDTVIEQFGEQRAFLLMDGEKSQQGEIRLQLNNLSRSNNVASSLERKIRGERFILKACFEPANGDLPASLGVYLSTPFKPNGYGENSKLLQAVNAHVVFKLHKHSTDESCGLYTKTKQWLFNLQRPPLQRDGQADEHGLKNFIPWKEFINPASGFVKNGKALLSAHVAVCEPVSRCCTCL